MSTKLPEENEVWTMAHSIAKTEVLVIRVTSTQVAISTVLTGAMSVYEVGNFIRRFKPPREPWRDPKEVTGWVPVDPYGNLLVSYTTRAEPKFSAKPHGLDLNGWVRVKLTPILPVVTTQVELLDLEEEEDDPMPEEGL